MPTADCLGNPLSTSPPVGPQKGGSVERDRGRANPPVRIIRTRRPHNHHFKIYTRISTSRSILICAWPRHERKVRHAFGADRRLTPTWGIARIRAPPSAIATPLTPASGRFGPLRPHVPIKQLIIHADMASMGAPAAWAVHNVLSEWSGRPPSSSVCLLGPDATTPKENRKTKTKTKTNRKGSFVFVFCDPGLICLFYLVRCLLPLSQLPIHFEACVRRLHLGTGRQQLLVDFRFGFDRRTAMAADSSIICMSVQTQMEG